MFTFNKHWLIIMFKYLMFGVAPLKKKSSELGYGFWIHCRPVCNSLQEKRPVVGLYMNMNTHFHLHTSILCSMINKHISYTVYAI
jgi:hypothetical protein